MERRFILQLMSLKPIRLGLTKIQSKQTISTSKNWRETKKKKRSTSQTKSLKPIRIWKTLKPHNNRKWKKKNYIKKRIKLKTHQPQWGRSSKVCCTTCRRVRSTRRSVWSMLRRVEVGMRHRVGRRVAGTPMILEEGRVVAGVWWKGIDRALKTSIFKTP